MFNFRQKIFVSHLLVFLLFIALMFPFASKTVKTIVGKAMEDRAVEVISKIQTSLNDDALIRRLKETKSLIFFRVSVISDEKKLLYDSHTKRILGPRFSQEYVVDHPEVLEAFQHGTGYNEEYSALLGQKFSYLAKSFDFHGKKYVLRTAVPYKYVADLSHHFEMGFLGLSIIVLMLFSLMTWFIIYHLTTPIQEVINAVKPYQEGTTAALPAITLKSLNRDDDFGKLAKTLNSMSSKIQKHIDSLTYERDEKEAILDSLIEGVIAIDRHMVVTFANNMALKLLGVNRDEFIGHSFSVALHHQCFNLIAACQLKQRVLTDTLIIKQNESKIYLDVVAAPKKANKGAILVLQDKSIQYKMLEMRKDFIANASHELKTPVTIIRGFAETLHEHPDLSPEVILEITSKIVKNCKRMTILIKDLLTLSDIENIPESRLIECDIFELTNNCCSMVLDAFPNAEITVRKIRDEDMFMTGDYNLLEMAMMNLIENAAKYSNPPAKISITFENIEGWIKVSIADKGIGIPVKDLGRIFERFYSANKAHSQKLGGSGLGLSIVENIISKHFGTISVTSTVNVGTTFTIIFPALKISQDPPSLSNSK